MPLVTGCGSGAGGGCGGGPSVWGNCHGRWFQGGARHSQSREKFAIDIQVTVSAFLDVLQARHMVLHLG